jgi:mRNA interferase MazF
MRRGEIWWADLAAPAGRRPVLLLSRDEAYAVRSLVTVAPITGRVRGIPVEVPLGAADGMPRDCAINLDSIVTIAKAHLKRRIAPLSPDKLVAAEQALRFALALDAPR